MPGQLINRFQVSLTEPYLFDLPIGASALGYLFNRIYPDWTESRAGGRFSLGKQFGTQTYADVAFRVEEVDFYGYRSPAPADYIAASGHTTLATLRPSLRFDNRNSPFMTNKGQYLELSFEQGWGNFTYPKAEVEGRMYFTLGTRADGSGKRILTFRNHLGATGRDTPVYERFFAGNFGKLAASSIAASVRTNSTTTSAASSRPSAPSSISSRSPPTICSTRFFSATTVPSTIIMTSATSAFPSAPDCG